MLHLNVGFPPWHYLGKRWKTGFEPTTKWLDELFTASIMRYRVGNLLEMDPYPYSDCAKDTSNNSCVQTELSSGPCDKAIIYPLRVPFSLRTAALCPQTKWGSDSGGGSTRLIHRRNITIARWQIWRTGTLHRKHFNHPTAVSDHFPLLDQSIKDIEFIPLEIINSHRDSIRKALKGFLM